MSALTTRIARLERELETGRRGLTIIEITGGLPGSELPSAEERERRIAEALRAGARTLIFGGLPLEDETEL